MPHQRTIGLFLVAVGMLLLYLGFQSTQAVDEQTSRQLVAGYAARTMWLVIGGAVLTVLGMVLAVVTLRLPRQ